MMSKKILEFSLYGKYYDKTELDRFHDDGCPNFPESVHENSIPVEGVKVEEWGENLKTWRIFSCGACGWYVWHPIGYCHKCGGRMVKLSGNSKDLQVYMNKNNFEDGGF